RHGLGKYPAATTNVQHTLASESRNTIHVSEPQRIDLVQRLEFALRIPPAVGQLTEFLEFDRIDIDHFQAAFRSTLRRGYALATLRPCAGFPAGPGARACQIRPVAAPPPTHR